jgi:hypothetical protein
VVDVLLHDVERHLVVGQHHVAASHHAADLTAKGARVQVEY